MITTTVTIPNKAGLHARAAAKLVATASAFRCRVEFANGDRTVDGKSILSLMLLAAPQGSELIMTLDGDDERDALGAILALIDNRFGED